MEIVHGVILQTALVGNIAAYLPVVSCVYHIKIKNLNCINQNIKEKHLQICLHKKVNEWGKKQTILLEQINQKMVTLSIYHTIREILIIC